MTLAAQEGVVPFGEALRHRLAVMQPSRRSLAQLVSEHPPEQRLMPGVLPLIRMLRAMGKRVSELWPPVRVHTLPSTAPPELTC